MQSGHRSWIRIKKFPKLGNIYISISIQNFQKNAQSFWISPGCIRRGCAMAIFSCLCNTSRHKKCPTSSSFTTSTFWLWRSGSIHSLALQNMTITTAVTQPATAGHKCTWKGEALSHLLQWEVVLVRSCADSLFCLFLLFLLLSLFFPHISYEKKKNTYKKTRKYREIATHERLVAQRQQ